MRESARHAGAARLPGRPAEVDAQRGPGRPHRVDVAFTPAEARPADVAIVIDVLRATSTVASALAGSVERVLCCAALEQAERLHAPGRALAGERRCLPIPGFDYGNSPRAVASADCRELVLCTTNGTPAIVAAAAQAQTVVLASLLNLDAAVETVKALAAGAELQLVCSGTDGRFALEDAYVAGRIVARLGGRRSDAAQAAERIAASYSTPALPLAQSADGRALDRTGQAEDLAYCSRESILPVVPRVDRVGDGVAEVSARHIDDAFREWSNISLEVFEYSN